jgi:DNA polymerase elongation subunit (family B)
MGRYQTRRLNTITTDIINEQDSNKLCSLCNTKTTEHVPVQTSCEIAYKVPESGDRVSEIIENADHVEPCYVSTLRTAIHYHDTYGFNTIPIPKPSERKEQLQEECGSTSEVLTADGKSAAGCEPWKDLQDRRQEIEDLIRRFEGKRDCNIANLTGTVLGVFAFDIDGDEARIHFDKEVARLDDDYISNAIKNTMVTKTGSGFGRHIIFRCDPTEFEVNNERIKTTTLWTGNGSHSEIKLKGDGGYIIAPPSLHASGKRYEFINEVVPICLTKQQINKLVGAFVKAEHKRHIISSIDVRKCNNSNNGNRHLGKEFWNLQNYNIEQIVSLSKDHYKEGHRDELIFGLSGLLFKNKVALISAKDLISTLCNSTNDEEKNSRIQVLENTYLKALNGDEISGATHVLEVLTLVCNNDKSAALQILQQISDVLHTGREQNDKVLDYGDGNNSDVPETVSRTLIKLFDEKALLFFKDQHDIPNVRIKVSDHAEIMPVQCKKCEYYIRKLYYDSTSGKKVAGSESLNTAIQTTLAKSLFSGQERTLNLRVAWGIQNREIHYDLGDAEWRCIKITTNDWEITPHSDNVLFTRFNQKAQIEPDRIYPPDISDRFLDLMHIKDSKHRLLSTVWIISLLIPDLPHPINITFGEKGSSKSTSCRFVKRLIDPDKLELLTIPKDKTEFVQQLYHNYIAVYDNVRKLPRWFSDEICKAITGIGNSKRGLYTNDEDIIYSYKRCLMINGINNSLTESDVLDRSILTEFERIPPEQRKEETKIESEYEMMRAKLLGYVLDTLVKALRIKPTIELSSLPRMADFTVWGEAIARAMGCKPMEFVNAYNDNIGRQNVETIESNPLCQALEKFVETWYEEGKEACWQSSTSKVLERLNKVTQTYGIDTSSKLWPKASNSLTKRLRPILSNLREGLGIHVVISRNTAGKSKNTSTIKIWKESPLPTPPPPKQIHAQDQVKSGGGFVDGGDHASVLQLIPPPESGINRAQETDSGDGGDGGGIIPILERDTELIHHSSPLPSTYVAFDFEWSIGQPVSPSDGVLTEPNTERGMSSAAFVDSNGNNKVLHISDFSGSDNPERELLLCINQELLNYNYSLGWYTTGFARYHEDTLEYVDGVDSDLVILHNRCAANNVDTIVEINSTGKPFIRNHTHIDLHSVFGKPMVQTTIFKNRYRTLKLDEVSKVVLSDNTENSGATGKYRGLTGKDIQSLPADEQKKYVLRDAELVMQLSKHNNGEVLDAMKSIAEITGLDFERVCRTGISTWWAAVFDNMAFNGQCRLYNDQLIDRNDNPSSELQYVGATVLQPKRGLYHDLIIVDVTSLYPTMAILHNLSFDTVNCECCKDKLQCRIPKDITRDCRIEKEYWICRRNEGAFPNKLKVFKEERLEQKKLDNRVKQLALKILINGGYGVFGSHYFKYYDPRVAELVTAYGRYTISRMKDIAKNMGFEIVYGDTDSLFLYQHDNNNHDSETGLSLYIKENLSRLRDECNKQLGIEVEHAKTYKTAIILDKKKHYIGWTGIEGSEPDIVGMEGDKNDRPKWINSVFKQTVHNILTNCRNNNCSHDPIINLRKAIADLQSCNVNPELLKRSLRLSKNPEEYENENDRKRKLGLAIGARKGDVIEYYESDNKVGYSLNPQDISFRKYIEMLWKTVKDILQIAGYDVVTFERQLFQHEISHMATPSRGVVGISSCISPAGVNEVAKDKEGGDR